MKTVIKILNIEDNVGDALLVETYLKSIESFNCEFYHQLDLKSGLQLLGEKEIDLILLDINLPDCSDLEGVEKITELFPNPALIVLTGLGSFKIGNAAIDLGAQDFLQKNLLDAYQLNKAIVFALKKKNKKFTLKERFMQKTKCSPLLRMI